jgi:hypothetical protein
LRLDKYILGLFSNATRRGEGLEPNSGNEIRNGVRK